MPENIGLTFQVIADGIDPNGDLRLSLGVHPALPADLAHPIDPAYWPSYVANLCRKLNVWVAPIIGVLDNSADHRQLGPVRGPFSVSVSLPWASDAHDPSAPDLTSPNTALWRKLFGADLPLGDPFGIDATMKLFVAVAASAGAGQAEASPPPRRLGYDSAQLARAMTDVAHSAGAATMMAHLARRYGAAIGLTGLPAAGFDAGLPSRKWWLRQHAAWLGVTALHDPVSRFARLRGVEPGDWLVAAGKPSQAGPAAISPKHLSESLAAISGRLDKATLDHDHWRGASCSISELAAEKIAYAPLASEVARFQTTLEALAQAQQAGGGAVPVAPRPVPVDDKDKDPTLPDNALRRKLGGILSYPALAKYFNLIIDIPVPPSDMLGDNPGSPTLGAVAVTLDSAGAPALSSNVWSSFQWNTPASGKAGYFGPASADCFRTAPAANLRDALLQNGVVNLRANYQSSGVSKRRFQLGPDDTSRRLAAFVSTGARQATAQAGGIADEDCVGLPEPQSRGIALFDAMAADPNADQTLPKQRVLRDAEDLLQGYRIDVYLAGKGVPDPADPKRWRTLTGRNLSLPALAGYHDGLTQEARITRSDGSVRPMTATGACPTGTFCFPHDTWFIWQGDGLGVPSLKAFKFKADDVSHAGRFAPIADAKYDLGLDVDIDAPSEARRSAPPLRVLRSYWFGARPVYAHGCSLSLGQAALAYSKPWLLGDPIAVDQPYVYRRELKIRAPELLLDAGDRIVTYKLQDADKGLLPATAPTIDDVVVGVTGWSDMGAIRYIAPPRASFDTGEQQGVFDPPPNSGHAAPAPLPASGDPDDAPDQSPPGAYGQGTISVSSITGEFPVARGGGVAFGKRAKDDDEVSRGLVMVFQSPPDPQKPFYIESPVYLDPSGRQLFARLIDPDEGPDCILAAPDDPDYGGPAAPLDFWGATESFTSAKPIQLQVNAASAGALGDKAARLTSRLASVPTKAGALSQLIVDVAPGASVTLELWAGDSNAPIAEQHGALNGATELALRIARGWLAGSFDPALVTAPVAAILAQLLEGSASGLAVQALAQAPVAVAQHRRRIRISHAVAKPGAPSFERAAGGGPQFYPVVLTVRANGGAGGKTWSEYVFDMQQSGVKPDKWLSQAGGSTAFFVGAVNTDRPTTGKLRCVAQWKEFDATGYVYLKDARTWTYIATPHTARLFAIDEPKIGRPGPIDLLFNEDQSLRSLSYSFADGRARKLELKLIATSRFTKYFPNDPGENASVDGPSNTVYLPCTFRPPPPDIDRVLPIFCWDDLRADANTFSFVRRVGLRIYLKRTWYASGVDEALAVLFAPSNSGGFNSVGRFEQYLTRQGDDPIHHVGRATSLIASNQVDGGVAPPPKPSGYNLYLTQTDDPIQSSQPTVLAGVDMRLLPLQIAPPDGSNVQGDASDTGHYCDFILTAASGYFPFVQLGLARFQQHALDTLELSYPVAVMAQLPPERRVTVTFKDGKSYTVTVSGPAPPDNAAGQIQTHMQMTVLPGVFDDDANVDGEARPGRWRNVGWDDRQFNEVDDHNQPTIQKPVVSGGQIKWTATGTLPVSLFGNQLDHPYSLLIEEFETVPGPDGKPVDRSPLFSAMINLAWNRDQ